MTKANRPQPLDHVQKMHSAFETLTAQFSKLSSDDAVVDNALRHQFEQDPAGTVFTLAAAASVVKKSDGISSDKQLSDAMNAVSDAMLEIGNALRQDKANNPDRLANNLIAVQIAESGNKTPLVTAGLSMIRAKMLRTPQ